jgi:sialate O-acetylesterase
MVWGVLSASVRAEIKLAPIFTDNMVLQRETPLPVWGTGAPGEAITVQLATQKRTANADDAGLWKVVFDPLTADGTALTLTVTGSSTVTLKNLVAGDVWICAGQSNMLFPLDHTINAKQDIPAANNPMIRKVNYNFIVYPKDSEYAQSKSRRAILLMMGNEGKSLADDLALHQTWEAITPDSAGSCSGVGYYFARDLYAAQKIPIGLVICAVGAQTIQTFISPSAFKTDTSLAAIYPKLEQQNDDRVKQYQAALAKWNAALAAAGPDGQAKFKPEDKPVPERCNEPSWAYNDIISGIIPFSIKGVLWYQGESNGATGYHTLFTGLIRDWRQQWGQGDFPFLFVQLPNFVKPSTDPNEKNSRAEMREEQAQALNEPNTAMAVLVDFNTDTDLHPKNKEPVGHRLALLARSRVYGEKIVADGPYFDSAALEGAQVRVKFRNMGGGLVLSSGDKLQGFALAGDDNKYVWADAKIDGDSVLVSSASVPAPKFVRYAWASNPICNLANHEGLPAAPFQTELK